MTDQHRWDAFGVHNPLVKTPNIDKLIREGILYSQAVCQAPICVPSRNSMMFGLYPSQIGARANTLCIIDGEDPLPSKPLPMILRDNGYQTAGFGKSHWMSGRFNGPAGNTRGFDTRAIGQPEKHYFISEQRALMMDQDNPEGLRRYNEEIKPMGPGEENVYGYEGCISKVAWNDHRDGWVTEKALDFLENDIDESRPLFFYLSTLKPHAGMNIPREFAEMYDINDIPDVPQPEWTEEPANHVDRNCEIPGDFQADRKPVWREAWEKKTPKERRMTTLRYWANCSFMDWLIGKAINKLKEKGILDNALVVFTSDHGDMMGERNHLFSKYNLFDPSVRVPLFVSGSFIEESKRGTVDDRPAENLDLYKTICEAAGTKYDTRLGGENLLAPSVRVGSVCEYHGNSSQKAPSYMWRKKDWKLIVYMEGYLRDAISNVSNGRGELYHLAKDPNEWNNLFYDKEHAELRSKMIFELLLHLMTTWAKYPGRNELEPDPERVSGPTTPPQAYPRHITGRTSEY